ncbi:MAG: PAS domain S-box protein [Nitrospinota bacterium]|nr:PAS domain S-box protein [Nitrospinota bacterium]
MDDSTDPLEITNIDDELWRSLVKNVTDIILLVDRDEKILYANHLPAGIDPSETIGKNVIDDYVDPEQREVVRAAFLDVMETGRTASYESIISIGPEEGKAWYSGRIAPVKLEGSQLCAVFFMQDVTELKAGKEEMHRFFDLTPEPMCIALSTGYFKKVNLAFGKILGYTREELLGQSFWEFIHPDDRGPTMLEVEKQLKGGATLSFANRYITKAGDLRWFSWRAIQDFETGLLYAAAEDITERKLAEDKLREAHNALERRVAERTSSLEEAVAALKAEMVARKKSEDLVRMGAARYRALIDAVMDGFMLLDDGGLILDVNETYLKMTGYERDDLVGRKISEVDAAQSPMEIGEYMKAVKRDGSARFETRHRKKDGKTIDMEVSASHEMIEGGFFIGLVRDITERRMFQHTQKLEAVGHLAGGMAHEFNNVLQGILGFSTLLEPMVKTDSTEAEYLERITQGTKRGADLVRRILAFSHKMELEKNPVSIPKVFVEVTNLLAGTLPATVKLIHHCQENTGFIKADHTQVAQVLLNLSINASHAMDDAGTLTLNAVDCHPGARDPHGDGEAGCGGCPFIQRKNRRSCISVGDTGHGMDQAIQEMVFEPFFTTKKKGVGTGLGLSVARGIVRENAGHIFFRSEKEKGTVFYVSFPTMGDTPARAPAHMEIQPLGRGERILFVDDEEMITTMAKIFLEEIGYHVDAFNSHKEALETFMRDPERFHLVVTDQTMRGATGAELAAKIKAIKPLIPILLITGYSRKLTTKEAARAGINRILYKPLHPQDLSRHIREALDGDIGVI